METKNHRKLIIIGSGPAGLTAGIYAGRANLRPLVFEGQQPGGQLTITTDVENYPGFPDGVQGPELMEILRRQAQRFGAEPVFKTVEAVDLSHRPFAVTADDEKYTAEALIIATGASAKWLNIPSEGEYKGYGVSACATCDGFFFRNQHVAVVGGGDTALEEASYLTNHASRVTIIHRRNELRASIAMQERVKKNPKVDFIWDSIIQEILGTKDSAPKKMAGLKLKNLKTGDVTDFHCDGLFLGIGHEPNTHLFKGVLEMDSIGYLKTKPFRTETNVPGVFAAGDVADSRYRQAISAAGSGCMASIDAERFLAENESASGH
ncbi:MAG: thioredoxin-disulfide reductase [Bacteroidota bacterium]